MLRIYADDVIAYDSRLPGYELLDLKVTTGLNKGGTAEITMPPGHPAYGMFTSYKTIVTIYRDDQLLFRGRALYPADDFYKRRTITCEGERCFLQDAVMRPYLYQDSPAAILESIIGLYNTQVEEPKQFMIGTIDDDLDPNNYVRIESESAEQVADTIDKLVKRVGGYIVFTTNTEGRRVINWYKETGYRSSQVIEFGENLLDFTRSQSADLATVVIPYGAKNEETGERVTITDINNGLDFIQDDAAVALRGFIAKPVFWDDVTDPANLLRKAQQYLATSKMLITTLSLTALDLSLLDKSIDSFQVGDTIRVRSKPHGVDDDFQLRERAYNLLDPAADHVVLGKDLTTLTGADAAGDRETLNQLHRTEVNIKSDYTLNLNKAVEETKASLLTLIQQTSDSIMLEVSQSYAKGDDIERQISTTLTQMADSFVFEFNTLSKMVDENDAEARERFDEISRYIRFENGNIVLGEVGNDLTLQIKNDRISFLDGGAEVAYFSNKQLYVLDGHFIHSMRVGKFAFLPRENGNLSLVKVEG